MNTDWRNRSLLDVTKFNSNSKKVVKETNSELSQALNKHRWKSRVNDLEAFKAEFGLE